MNASIAQKAGIIQANCHSSLSGSVALKYSCVKANQRATIINAIEIKYNWTCSRKLHSPWSCKFVMKLITSKPIQAIDSSTHTARELVNFLYSSNLAKFLLICTKEKMNIDRNKKYEKGIDTSFQQSHTDGKLINIWCRLLTPSRNPKSKLE